MRVTFGLAFLAATSVSSGLSALQSVREGMFLDWLQAPVVRSVNPILFWTLIAFFTAVSLGTGWMAISLYL